jgi:hypothetical protein
VDKFVAKLDIERFRRNLATETDEAKRKMFLTLLAEEEALTGINGPAAGLT